MLDPIPSWPDFGGRMFPIQHRAPGGSRFAGPSQRGRLGPRHPEHSNLDLQTQRRFEIANGIIALRPSVIDTFFPNGVADRLGLGFTRNSGRSHPSLIYAFHHRIRPVYGPPELTWQGL